MIVGIAVTVTAVVVNITSTTAIGTTALSYVSQMRWYIFTWTCLVGSLDMCNIYIYMYECMYV